ncbi:MAG: DUF4026 domain-containing protein [Bacilli bacterium]|nr:DUF4026 domain-containing protein [Bacilli bacterium]
MRKKTLVEAPLGYWEEKSYFIAIPADETRNLLKDCLNGISSLEDVEIIDNHHKIEGNFFELKLKYEKEVYEVGFYVGDVSVPEYYLAPSFLFEDQEKESLLKARKAVTIFMKFQDDVKKSYHLQLKLAVAMVPDLIGLLDESAERLFPAKWVKMTASSKVLPSSKDLFNVQAVRGKNDEVWLHTHGLCRCGVTELEILESDAKNYENHYNLISTYAMYLIDHKGDIEPYGVGAYIGSLVNGYPVVVTCKSWTEGILEYKKLRLGNLKDREKGHNSKTSIIFLYKSEEDEKQGVLSKVSIYNDLWGENPIFFISDEETDRMKKLAREKFNYVQDFYNVEGNSVLIKIGLHIEGDNYEHIWFELLEVKKDKFRAKLTQESYYFKDMHVGDEHWYTVDDVTDWIIYTPKFAIHPGSVFLLDR